MPEITAKLSTALADRYKIESHLGEGGMANVYLAEDLKHHRKVAVKVLRPELAAVLGAERFVKEIETTANLQHPHILPLFDSGEADSFLYYVMPFIDGETLRDKLNRETQLGIDEAVGITTAIADALDYAHRNNVIHRDIKPENILLHDGRPMVADFGIALALSAAAGGRMTETGMSLGTPHYMSPEQATAEKDLTNRSDIYSLGCVRYEMLTGEPPHTGNTAQAIISRIMMEQPTSIRLLRETVPEHVEQMVMKALAKVPADRWQSADEMLPHLEATAGTSGGLTPTSTRPIEGAGVAAPRRRVWWMAAGAAAAVIVIAVFGATVLRDDPFTITTSNILQVTSEPGRELQPSLSPDGNEVSYVVGTFGAPRIVIRSTINISSGGETRRGEGIKGVYVYPNWAPDGASIRFGMCVTFFSNCGWREVGKLGGTSTPLGVPSDLTSFTHGWSPDGTRVAFSRRDSIFAYSTGDTEPQLLGVHTLDPAVPHSFAWSPDGQLLAYVNANDRWRYSGNLWNSSIWIIDANGGEPVAITSEEHMNLSPQWLPDGRHILFVSNRDGPRGIYLVEVGPDGPLGDVQSVVSSSDPHSISLSRNGKKLAYSKFQLRQNIWSIPIPRSEVLSIKDAQPVTTGNQVIEVHDLSPDGRFITYSGSRLGNADIYRMPLEGGTAQLIADLPGDAFYPAWSPDGTEIAFYAVLPGTGSGLFVVPANGGDPRLVADFPHGDLNSAWSPDGLHIAFPARGPQVSDPNAIWTVSRERVGDDWGDPVRLTDFTCLVPDWAPDGESLVCVTGLELVIVSKTVEIVTRFDPQMGSSSPHFSPDGSEVYFFVKRGPAPGVWSFPVTGGEATQLVAFDDPSVSVFTAFTVGADHFYLSISEYESDIYVMDLEW